MSFAPDWTPDSPLPDPEDSRRESLVPPTSARSSRKGSVVVVGPPSGGFSRKGSLLRPSARKGSLVVGSKVKTDE